MTTHPRSQFREAVFLLEIETQCDLVLRARDRMRSGVTAFNDFSSRADHDIEKTGRAPNEILRSAHSFLTHSAIVYRLVCAPFHLNRASREQARDFAKGLRKGMALGDLPNMRDAHDNLRNSFEHVDERLWGFLEGFETDGENRTYSAIHVLKTPPREGRRFLRWISPDPLQVTFGDVTMNVDEICKEIETVKEASVAALRTLNEIQGYP